MAVSSSMIPLGTLAPDFALTDVVTGATVRRDDVAGEHGLLVMFICNHCPYVKRIKAGLATLGRDYADSGIGIVAISPNDPISHPEDAPERMAEEARTYGYPFPYLFDDSQDVAKAYTAACTPDFFLFDGDSRLVYRGQLDDARPSNDIPVTGRDLRAAFDALLAGTPVPAEQRPSIGCSIKWKPGNAPS